MTSIKTIDIQAKEWFDRINGNSYFSAVVSINYGMADAKTIYVPFQYGYGDHYKDVAFDELEKAGIITDRIHHANSSKEPLFRYCSNHGIVLNTSKKEKASKSDVKAYGMPTV